MSKNNFDLNDPEVQAFAKFVAELVVKSLNNDGRKTMLTTKEVCKRYSITPPTLKKWRDGGFFPDPDFGGTAKGANCLWKESTLTSFDAQRVRF